MHLFISRYMFWTDWGLLDPKIERADLTGFNRQLLIPLGFSWWLTFTPMDVVVDYQAGRIYWMDAYDNYIDSTDLDGYDITTLHYIDQNIFPANLALYGDYLYWVDWNSQSVQYLNKTRPLLMRNYGHLSDVYLTGAVVSDQSRQSVGNYLLCKILYQSTALTFFASSHVPIGWCNRLINLRV